MKWQPLEGTLLRVSYYDIKEDNALRPDPDNPLNAIQSGTTKSQGFEFQATSRQSGDRRQRDNVPKDLASIFGTKTLELADGLTLHLDGGVRCW